MLDHNFRSYLQSELIRRCNNNSKYSLRAFAKHLGIDASPLSQIVFIQRDFIVEDQKDSITYQMESSHSFLRSSNSF